MAKVKNDKFLAIGREIILESSTLPDKKAASFIRGWRFREFVLVDPPKVEGKYSLEAHIKTPWIVRYAYRGKMTAFKVKGAYFLNYMDLFVLEFPVEAKTHSLRQHLRADMNMPVKLFTGNDPDLDFRYRGMSLDLSAGGLSLIVPKKVNPKRGYFVTVYLPTGVALKDVKCNLTRMQPVQHGFEVGIKFNNLDTGYKKAVDFCLNQLFGLQDAKDDA